MSINAISSNAYLLVGSAKSTAKHPVSTADDVASLVSRTATSFQNNTANVAAPTGQNIPVSSPLGGASNAVLLAFQEMNSSSRPEDLTDSQWLTQLTAGLGASDYAYAKLALSEIQSPERLASGEATDTIKMNFKGHTFTIAVKPLSRAADLKPVDVSNIADISLPHLKV